MQKMGIERLLVSGLSGAGKSILASKISYIYGWEVHSIGGMFKRMWADRYPNQGISFEEYWANISPQENLTMNNHAREFFEKRKVILESRYSEHYRDIDAAFVFVTCELNGRSRRSRRKYPGKSPEEIAAILKRREEDEVEMGSRMYGEHYDFRDSKNYDLVIDTTSMSIDEEIKLVRELIEKG